VHRILVRTGYPFPPTLTPHLQGKIERLRAERKIIKKERLIELWVEKKMIFYIFAKFKRKKRK
jgi:hypothetical protein